MKTVRASNIFYWSHLNVIGGVETWLYELAKKYGNTHDIIIVYDTADKEQRERLRPLVRTIKNEGQHFECDKLFIGFGGQIILPQVDAKEVYQVLHADYKEQNLASLPKDKVTGYIGVSGNTCKTFEEMTGNKAELCYNPIGKRKPKKVLHLISATRISAQKAPHSMVAFAQALDKSKIPYVWDIFSDGRLPDYVSNNVVYHAPTLNILDYVAEADYLVQFSTSEGYSYSIIESLMVGTPVIVHPIGALEDMQVKDKVNAFVIPFDMSDIPIKEIYKGLPKFTYTPRKDDWKKFLAEGESNYNEWRKKPVRIKTIRLYHDILLDREMRLGEEQEVNRTRAERLIELGLAVEVEDEQPVSV